MYSGPWAAVPNPKRSLRDEIGRNAWYPFYPGYSASFSSYVIRAFNMNAGALLLDPWNGSGTTTSSAAQMGIQARGVDLNPAMVVIAKAKLLDPLDAPSLRPLARQVKKVMPDFASLSLEEDDPLYLLFARSGAEALRGIDRGIRSLLVEPERATSVSDMSPIAAFFYVALFRACRVFLHRLVGTNPVWTRLRLPGREKPRPSRDSVVSRFMAEVEAMLASEHVGRPRSRSIAPIVDVSLGSSTNLPFADSTVDAVLSSPPYCTRVDYAVATLPELSILGLKRGTTFDELRRRLIGTTTVPRSCDHPDEAWGATCLDFLNAVKSHPSVASTGYYLKNHAQYFAQYYASLKELRRVMRAGGTAVLVVQDSYYKDVRNDLATITIEMARDMGFSHVASRHFALKRSLAQSNPRARQYRAKQAEAVETVVVLSAMI